MAEQKRKRIMTLVEKRGVATFTKDGEQNTIWSLDALDADGNPITGYDLRTFDDGIPLGERREFYVQKYVHEKYGESYTVTVPREKLGPRVQALEAFVVEQAVPMIATVKRLEERLKELEEEPGF